MKQPLHPTRTVVAWTAIILLSACGDDPAAPAGPDDGAQPVVASVQVVPASATITALRSTRQFSALAKDASGRTIAGKRVKWTSDLTSVASIDTASGLLTAVGNGTTTVQARIDEVSGAASVTVAQTVSFVAISASRDTLGFPGDTVKLSAQAQDALFNPVENPASVWASSDASVLIVDSTGLVTGVSNGTAAVSATMEGIEGRVWMTVHVIPVARFEMPDTADAGSQFEIAMIVNTEGMNQNVGAVAATVNWDPRVLQLQDVSENDFPYMRTLPSESEGWLRLLVSNPDGVTDSSSVATFTFSVVGTSGTITSVDLAIDQIIAALTFEDHTAGVVGYSRAVVIR